MNETHRDREIVAWRNRFPDFVYMLRTGMVVSRTEGLPMGSIKYQCAALGHQIPGKCPACGDEMESGSRLPQGENS